MILLFVLLLLIGLAAGVLGFVIKGFIWLGMVGVVLVVVCLIGAGVRSFRSSARPR